MRFAIIICSTNALYNCSPGPPQIFSGDIPFEDISGWLSLRSNVVKYAKRPAKPQPPDDVGREFDDNLWSLIEECWSQEPSNRPTAATVSLRLGGVNGCLVNPAEMYKKEIAVLTEELARVKKRSKATIQDLETELAELKKNLNEERDLRKRVEKKADELRDSLARRELEQAELKKDLDGERDLRKQVEKNADERIKAARRDLEMELANLPNPLARQELEQAEPKMGVYGERQLLKQLETDADEFPISILRTDGPGVSPSEPMALVQKPIVQAKGPSIPNGIYIIKNRARNVYWCAASLGRAVYFRNIEKNNKSYDKKVSEHSSPITQVLNG